MRKKLEAVVPLTYPLEEAIRRVIERGEYDSQVEVIQSALGLWLQRYQEREAAKEQFREQVEEGVDSGPSVVLDMPAIRERVKMRLSESRAK